MIISASQLKDYIRCPRLWWFKKVIGLPGKGQVYGHVFGRVLHSVLERHLAADQLGRDKAGNPVDLYPEGWNEDADGNALDPEDEHLLKDLVDQAIQAGMLTRHPEGQVERNFTVPLIPDVVLTGFVDYAAPNRLVDHKGLKRSRYKLSQEALADDLQMLLYAKQVITSDRNRVFLTHNYFDREKGKAYPTKEGGVYVAREEIEAKWAFAQAVAKEMLDLKNSGTQKEQWETVEDKAPEACAMYGGCQFQTICWKRETPYHYQRRMKRLKLAGPRPKPEILLTVGCRPEKNEWGHHYSTKGIKNIMNMRKITASQAIDHVAPCTVELDGSDLEVEAILRDRAKEIFAVNPPMPW